MENNNIAQHPLVLQAQRNTELVREEMYATMRDLHEGTHRRHMQKIDQLNAVVFQLQATIQKKDSIISNLGTVEKRLVELLEVNAQQAQQLKEANDQLALLRDTYKPEAVEEVEAEDDGEFDREFDRGVVIDTLVSRGWDRLQLQGETNDQLKEKYQFNREEAVELLVSHKVKSRKVLGRVHTASIYNDYQNLKKDLAFDRAEAIDILHDAAVAKRPVLTKMSDDELKFQLKKLEEENE